ncbi:ABC transporter ATP-binding protein [Bosea sp. UNC402CLCol]|uniref:ABC transporter ATP-binding protein n=1 Tax=Bosea sp. UNC402CLCol TaxID=1510531 RepID=UPI000570990C|nr:ABC transporter ATP-binding protein [Bosea sp. UNC402CLCol]
MSSDIAISVTNAGKCYLVYDKPEDRLKQALFGGAARMLGRPVPKYFREFWALRDVGFEIRRGETVGIIGRNGAGKSTLLQMICGTLTPTVGHIATRGRVAALLELGAGFNPEFTGRENVQLNASILGLTDAEIEERFPAVAEFAGLGDFIDQPVKTYSSGMTVRLAFAVIAHVDADILIIDEALAVGDAFFVQKCMRFLRDFTKRGTLLFVSHDSAAVLSLCDRAIWLDGGTLVQDGTPKEVSDGYLAKLYETAQGPASALRKEPEGQKPSPGDIDGAIEKIGEVSYAHHEGATSFGAGGAEIRNVVLLDAAGHPVLGVEGGENVTLVILVKAIADMSSPIVGFYIRDRLGQNLIGENTYLSYEGDHQAVSAGQTLRARFDFKMPYLMNGDYSVCVAVADGSQTSHVQHHWVNDALIFKSYVRHGHRGLVGLPDMGVKLEAVASS